MIDCEIHNEVPSTEALFPYLPVFWREHITNTLFKGPIDSLYPRNSSIIARPGSRPADGTPPGSSLDLIRAQVLDGPGAELGILTCTYPIDGLRNPDAAVALARACNDWQINEWLDKEPRLRGSIVVPSQLPHEAAREIDRVASHPGFVQVMLPVRAAHPYGNRLFHPLFEAIARHDLAVGLHFGGVPGNPPTSSGWPSYFIEEYVDMATVFQSQTVSMISEGLFDQFPNLRVVLLESGFSWLPAHMWRFDKEWRNLRRLVPWVKRLPSAYIREHMRITVQPLDAPQSPQQLLETIDQIGSDDLLLYASDYPHVHAADPHQDLLPLLPETLRRKILSENARAFYRL